MAFTLEQLDFLNLRLGVAIPPAFIENKRREQEFKKRSAEIAARWDEMKQRSDGHEIQELYQRAGMLAGKDKNFAEALKLLDETEHRLAQPDVPPEPALPVWQQAKETVDAQLNVLYDKLKSFGVPVLEQAASQIEEVLGNYRTKMVVALTNYDNAAGPARDKARAQALEVVASYQEGLANDKHVIAADSNPFGVNVTIRETLGAAFSTLNQQLTPN